MKILLCCIPFDRGRSGVSVYLRNVARALAEAGHDLTLLVENGDEKFFPGYKLRVAPGWTRRNVCNMLYCMYVLPWTIRRGEFDRVIFGAANRRMAAFSRCPATAVVHDLSQYHIPGKYDIFRMFYIKCQLPKYVRKADTVAAVSNSTADDLVRYYRVPRGKIVVAWNGIEKHTLPLNSNDGAWPVVLYVSRLEFPGKNHINLIKAWELLPGQLTDRYKLVLAGADWSGAAAIHQYAEKSPKHASIEFTGFISDEQLHDYYRHARVYIFPSLFEGFGLSLAEAMACGVISACSNNSSLGEIAGDAALTFDPMYTDEIADAIGRTLTDETLRAELRRKGLARAELFDWRRHAEILTAAPAGYAELFGVKCFTGGMETALDEIASAAAQRQSPCFFGAFVNADCLNQACVNADYRALLGRASRVWPDGVGVAIAAKHAGTPVRDNINGTDMLPLLCRKNFKLFLLGGAPGVASAAAEKLAAKHRGLHIAGTHDGFFAGRESEVIDEINRSGADILLVAMGVPRQEQFIDAHRNELRVPVAMGVGGLLDFASERIPRAPLWMRRAKIEWIYRLYQEPRRLFRRYILGNPLFLWRVFIRGNKIPAGK